MAGYTDPSAVSTHKHGRLFSLSGGENRKHELSGWAVAEYTTFTRLNAKKHLFHTHLPPETHARLPSVRSEQRLLPAQVSSCSEPAASCTLLLLGLWKKHDDMSKAARLIPSMFLRMGGGPVGGTLMLRKAKHWWPALGNNEVMEMDRERKGSQCEMLCVCRRKRRREVRK